MCAFGTTTGTAVKRILAGLILAGTVCVNPVPAQTGSVDISFVDAPRPLVPGSTVTFQVFGSYRLQGSEAGIVLRVSILGPGDELLQGETGAAIKESPAELGSNFFTPPIEFANVRVPQAGPVIVRGELRDRGAADPDQAVIGRPASVLLSVRGSGTNSIRFLSIDPPEGTTLTAGDKVDFQATVLADRATSGSNFRIGISLFNASGSSLGQREFSARGGLNQVTADFPNRTIPDTGPVRLTARLFDGDPPQNDLVTPAEVLFPVGGALPPEMPPVITSISPDTVVEGGPGFDLTVNGSGFKDGAVVEWGETQIPLDTSFQSASQLIAVVPEALIAPPGEPPAIAIRPGPTRQDPRDVPVGVRNPPTAANPGGLTSDPALETILQADKRFLPPGAVVPKPPKSTDSVFLPIGLKPIEVPECTFREEGRLEFRIRIDRYVGEIDKDFNLLNIRSLTENGVVAPFARLIIPAWDVDAQGNATGVAPELDKVFINGINPGPGGAAVHLKGFHEKWSINEIPIPIELLRFPALPPHDSGPLLSG